MIEAQQQTTAYEPERQRPQAGSPEPSLTLPLVLAILLRSRKLILTSAVTAAVIAGIIALLLPNTYTATVSFLPPGTNTGTSAAALMGQLSSLGGATSLLGAKSQGDLYVGILKSQTIAREMVRRFDLVHLYRVKKASQAAKVLAGNSVFLSDAKDSIVTISVKDKSPARARDLAAGYLDALQNAAQSLALTESSQRRLFYEQRLAKAKDDLANAEVALKQSEEKTGLIAPAGQTASNIQALAQLQAQITDRQTRLAAMLHDETEENPDVVRMRMEINTLQAQLAQRENGAAAGHFGSFSNAQVPAMQLEYIRKQRDVKYYETLFEIIAKQYEAARLDEAKDAPLQVLDTPAIPDTKSGPPRTILVFIGGLMGLMGGSGWVLLRAARRGDFL